MSERKISYLNKTYEDYRDALREMLQVSYPSIANDVDDASVGSWIIDMLSSIGDNLTYHIDRAYSETNIDSAQKTSSVYAIARNNGFKVPGPKGSITEVEFTCQLSVTTSGYTNSSSELGMPDYTFAPIIKKGTKLKATNNTMFEVMEDIDFTEQFNNDGVSDRTITPYLDANGNVKYYVVSKKAVVVSGESKVYKMTLNSSQIVPFMEILLPDSDVMNVESILVMEGQTYQYTPSTAEFMQQEEYRSVGDDTTSETDIYRFFEVDSLIEQYRWGDDISNNKEGNQSQSIPVTDEFVYHDDETGVDVSVKQVTKGKWTPLTQKFITEFTDKGYLKIIFGSGEQIGQEDSKYEDASTYAQYRISQMIRNNFLGKLPKAGTTVFILYRRGGGADSNVAKDTVNKISYLNCDSKTCPVSSSDRKLAAAIMNTIKVTNTIPSVSGKDAPTVEEVKAMIKYNNAAQNRCVTVKDYENRLQLIPPRYGNPFRLAAVEENNKIMIYMLGINHLGYLTDILPTTMLSNFQDYLSKYRAINDYVEMKSGRIINLSFEADIYTDKNYNSGDVVNNVLTTIKDYMDINKHFLGEDIFIGDLEKEISKIDGVINLIDLRVYNEFGDEYSQTQISQQTTSDTDTEEEYTSVATQTQIDLENSDFVLNSEADEMFEIKYTDKDIRVRIKTR